MRVGSGMQGGSSGGPHIVNLGALSNSAADKGGYTTRNVVYAVTSWGYTDGLLMIQGASTTLSGPSNVATASRTCSTRRAPRRASCTAAIPARRSDRPAYGGAAQTGRLTGSVWKRPRSRSPGGRGARPPHRR